MVKLSLTHPPGPPAVIKWQQPLNHNSPEHNYAKFVARQNGRTLVRRPAS